MDIRPRVSTPIHIGDFSQPHCAGFWPCLLSISGSAGVCDAQGSEEARGFGLVFIGGISSGSCSIRPAPIRPRSASCAPHVSGIACLKCCNCSSLICNSSCHIPPHRVAGLGLFEKMPYQDNLPPYGPRGHCLDEITRRILFTGFLMDDAAWTVSTSFATLARDPNDAITEGSEPVLLRAKGTASETTLFPQPLSYFPLPHPLPPSFPFLPPCPPCTRLCFWWCRVAGSGYLTPLEAVCGYLAAPPLGTWDS